MRLFLFSIVNLIAFSSLAIADSKSELLEFSLVHVKCMNSSRQLDFYGYLKRHAEYPTPKGLSFSATVRNRIVRNDIAVDNPLCSFKYEWNGKLRETDTNAINYSFGTNEFYKPCGPRSSITGFPDIESLRLALIKKNLYAKEVEVAGGITKTVKGSKYRVSDESCIILTELR